MKLPDIFTHKRGDDEVFRVQGLTPSSQALVLSQLFYGKEKSILLLTADNGEAERFADDISFFLGNSGSVIFLPQWEILPYEPLSPHVDIASTRRTALQRLLKAKKNSTPIICVTTFAALMQKTPPMEVIGTGLFTIKKGEEVDIGALKSFLVSAGYFFNDPVDEAGCFAFRGGILDIFSPSLKNPIRIELFGDEVDSIRSFDLDSQRSIEWLNSVEIPPLKETAYGAIDTEWLMENLSALEERHSISLSEIRNRFASKEFFPAMELYLPYFYRETPSPMRFLPDDFNVVVSEPERCDERRELFLSEIETGYAEAIERKDYYPSPDELFANEEELSFTTNEAKVLEFYGISTSDESERCVSFLARDSDRYHGAFNRFVYDAKEHIKKGISTLIVVRAESSIERVEKFMAGEEVGILKISTNDVKALTSSILADDNKPPRIMVTVSSGFTSGFISEKLKLSVITEEEIFGRSRLVGKKRAPKKEAVFASAFSDIAPGDYVVHRDHGIGVYNGIRHVAVGAKEASDEYLELEYAESQLLFLPLSSVYLVEKYSGGGGARPALDRMGGKTWQKTREKVRKGIFEMAGELLEIFAKRQTGTAYKFSTDNVMNNEFSDSFEFSETEGQAAAIDDVLRDMASDKPMDRLVCGDVGYGKTEIAMRAAFAASLDGKQTAILTPTTLLARQHWENFSQRMTKFGVTVEMLSRYVTPQQQKETIEKIRNGKVDVVIGTHRLLQKDIIFGDLGLIIIDEEQRFGVAHKEKLKKLRATVDVLTLTATPIPRTLHMAISGIREISIISTPPPNRLSIKTLIRRKGDEVIKEAVNRELSRGGQIFFVHNSVETIQGTRTYLNSIVPSARIMVAHGQMGSGELEKAMDAFIHHKVDILLCTTIIESGLDIPNANTIIVNRADKFGLSQLYQLRGRVGRDKHRAYAYLLVPDSLTPIARKRIKAIEELSELGSGFKLASRDMEIRGTGNLLGSQQSGQITAVGFETYCRMLSEAVEEIKTGSVSSKVEMEMDLEFTGKLEESYIPALEQRMDFYNRLYRCEKPDELEQIVGEMIDRYGQPTDKAKKLFDAMLLRIAGSRLGIAKLSLKGRELTLQFPDSSGSASDVAEAAVLKFPGKTKPVGNNVLVIDISSLLASGKMKGVQDFLLGIPVSVNQKKEDLKIFN